MCSMASNSYGSSSTNNSFVFDIFINHRGPDTKETLAKHLYDRLTEKRLRVFLDKHELQAGECITPQIHSAIRTASVHIAIFSPGYADSPWCLDELLLMFKSVLESRSTIIPVFYDVEPADLRWVTQSEKGVYARSLQTLEKKRTADSKPRYGPDIIQEWRKAVTDAAEIKGFDKKTYNGNEQQLIEHVVEGVLRKVKRPLHVSRYPTGLDEKVAEFERAMLLYQQSSRETRVIGIVGPGGVGKTTLAKEICNRRRSNYKRTSFQFDVRENVKKHSLKYVQSEILRDFEVNVQIGSTDDGIEKLHSYLKSSHAFLILDDVADLQQVETLLLPVKDALQQGSLILVTSRNKDVLTRSGIAESSIFKLQGLDQHHSPELFCWHAFDQRDPPMEFKQVVEEFVDACAGLPLSLKVLGSLLRGKDLEYGKALLHHISKIHPEDIMETIDLDWCSSLQVLPGSLGSLRNLNTIDLSGCSSLELLPNSFGNLTNLKAIDLSGCSSLQGLPGSFGNLKNLKAIDLSWCSSLQGLPDSSCNLSNLKTIQMFKCSGLRVLPDSFGNLTNLQTIDLSWCSSLQVLPDSFGNLKNLQTIDLSGCSRLQVLPDSFGNLIQLERLQFHRLIVSPQCFENMCTFKCSDVIDFKRVEVSLPCLENTWTLKCIDVIDFNRVLGVVYPGRGMAGLKTSRYGRWQFLHRSWTRRPLPSSATVRINVDE